MISYNQNRKDLQIDRVHEDISVEIETQEEKLFWQKVEFLAVKYEVTSDYILAEFMI